MKEKKCHIANLIVLAVLLPGLAITGPLSTLSAQTAHDSLKEAEADTRYVVRRDDGPAKGKLAPAYRAPNPAQQYDAYFTPNGLSLSPGEAAPEWRMGLRLIGYGYGENLLMAGIADVKSSGARVEYRRSSPPITEWYVNKAAGLEQGFTIETAPGPRADGDRLRLALELTGDLSAELRKGGQAINLRLRDGEPALSYGGLHAYDTQGQKLPSRMKLNVGQVILEVDDENAIYPVTIDPTFKLETKLLHIPFSPNDPEFFGSSVDVYGDTVVVGAPSKDKGNNSNQGAAYVYTYDGANKTWTYHTTLWASDGATGDYFGQSVAISGNTIVVGAPYADVNSNANQGAAYVFVNNGGVWTEEQKIMDIGGTAQALFGVSVDISLDTIVIGSNLFPQQGAAFVFVRSSGFWSPQQKLTNDNRNTYPDSFGVRVAVDLNTVVVGAPQDLIGNNSQQGSAYVFARSGTVWNKQAKLIAGDGAASDQFGVSVAISGNWVVVGAHFDAVGAALQGSAYVFQRSFSSSWNQQAKLTASDGMANDYFGWSVAIHGYTIVVGAHYDDEGQNNQQGSAYVFTRSGQIWTEQPKLLAFDGRTSDRFGASVSTSAGAVVVGSPSHDYYYRSSACILWWCNAPDQGAVYAFRQ